MIPGGYSIKITLGRPLNWEGRIRTQPMGGSLNVDTSSRSTSTLLSSSLLSSLSPSTEIFACFAGSFTLVDLGTLEAIMTTGRSYWGYEVKPSHTNLSLFFHAADLFMLELMLEPIVDAAVVTVGLEVQVAFFVLLLRFFFLLLFFPSSSNLLSLLFKIHQTPRPPFEPATPVKKRPRRENWFRILAIQCEQRLSSKGAPRHPCTPHKKGR